MPPKGEVEVRVELEPLRRGILKFGGGAALTGLKGSTRKSLRGMNGSAQRRSRKQNRTFHRLKAIRAGGSTARHATGSCRRNRRASSTIRSSLQRLTSTADAGW